MPGQRVLVVEDDHGLRDVLARGLRQAGFEVVAVADGTSALRTAAGAERIDGVVLDIGLPDADGRDVCIALRSRGIDVPVLFLTARGALGDRLSGFSAGGDDYLPKPFAFPELVARLTALLRRAVDSVTVSGDLELDPAAHALSCGSTQVPLSPTEFRLLARMLGAPGAVVRRHELVAAGWPHGAIVSENTLDQYVSKLRRKMAEVGSVQTIESARGVGFRLG
jgi:two-component system response regulator MprA